jgi:hypothetical protein
MRNAIAYTLLLATLYLPALTMRKHGLAPALLVLATCGALTMWAEAKARAAIR